MTKVFNRLDMRPRRRSLRNNPTTTEKLLWEKLRKNRLNHRFLRQYSIEHYVVDFYCPELKFAIEVDGNIHDTEWQRGYDKNRDDRIAEYGIVIFRITNQAIKDDIEKVVKEIKTRMTSLYSNPSQPPLLQDGRSRNLRLLLRWLCVLL